MRNTLFVLILGVLTAGCGKPPTSTVSSTAAAASATSVSTTHSCQFIATGDGMQFSGTIIANLGASDQAQTYAPAGGGVATIPVSGQISLTTNNVRTCNIQVAKVGSGGDLFVKAFRDGVLQNTMHLINDSDSVSWSY